MKQKEKRFRHKTWFIDIDGTIVKHMSDADIEELIIKRKGRSHLYEEAIPKSVDFVNKLPKDDVVVLTTARNPKTEQHTLKMLERFKIRYDKIIFDLNPGPRYLINDTYKGARTAYSINVTRDEGIELYSESPLQPDLKLVT
jgi:hypothetical protein|tara:strand:- start:715 stop:1140 length:426 start_codon:yes stop_codon:yes gene_type:complete